MQLRRVEIIKYRNFENVIIDFEKSNFPNVFSIASKNGGGKSTLIQFIFIILHCFLDEERKQYIINLLDEFSDITKDMELVKFTIEDDKKEYTLDFSISSSRTEDRNFDLYLDLKDTQNYIKRYKEDFEENQKILNLKQDIDNSDRVTPIIERNLRYIKKYIKSKKEDDLYRQALRSNDVTLYKTLINMVIDDNTISKDTINDLQTIVNEIQIDIEQLENLLKTSNITYITHLKDNKNVLLLETIMSKDLLQKLVNKVFLTAPTSQVFLFLSNEVKQSIFNEMSMEDYSNPRYYYSYNSNVRRAKDNLNNFFTYDFASTKLILEAFDNAKEQDFTEMRVNNQYGTNYINFKEELKSFLDGKEISESKDGTRIIFKTEDIELKAEDLSHGELKKLGIYIWLKYIVPSDSIILMDEVDIALHPKWQYQLIKDLSKWSCNSQFLLATHSPQILSSTYYKNIIKLDNGQVTRYKKPPIDRDINAIIVEIMEAPDFPEDLLELHKKYRKLVNTKTHETEDGKALRAEILEYESESSEFFQDINMDLELI